MLKVSHVGVYNIENAIRGMRNPLSSWDKSDSFGDSITYYTNERLVDQFNKYELGDKDLDLAKRLVSSGTDHGKFLRQILVSVDIEAPLYWWKEADTYKVGTVANSTSTMHTIMKKEFSEDMFSFDCLTETNKEIILHMLNELRKDYLETKSKDTWRELIQVLPNSFNQLRTVTLNYQVLRNMYHSRRNHKLFEWHTLCDWIETLPYSELITM